MIDLIDPLEGRIVNTCSDSGPEWLAKQNDETKDLFSNSNLSTSELDSALKSWFKISQLKISFSSRPSELAKLEITWLVPIWKRGIF